MTTPLATMVDTTRAALQGSLADDTASRAQVEQLKSAIDVASAASVRNFGREVEQDVAGFVDTVLEQLMSRDTEAVHDRLAELRAVVSSLEVEAMARKRGFFDRLSFKMKREITTFAERFQKARQRSDTISARLDDQCFEINNELVVLGMVFERVMPRFTDLTLHIRAGREVSTASEQGSEREVLDRRVQDLEAVRAAALTILPAIRRFQQTAAALVEDLRTTVAHAIPAWRSAMLVHIEQLRRRHGFETPRAARDFNNTRMKPFDSEPSRPDTTLDGQTRAAAADSDAMADTVKSLIATIDEVDRLERETSTARLDCRRELGVAQAALRARLIEAQTRTPAS